MDNLKDNNSEVYPTRIDRTLWGGSLKRNDAKNEVQILKKRRGGYDFSLFVY